MPIDNLYKKKKQKEIKMDSLEDGMEGTVKEDPKQYVQPASNYPKGRKPSGSFMSAEKPESEFKATIIKAEGPAVKESAKTVKEIQDEMDNPEDVSVKLVDKLTKGDKSSKAEALRAKALLMQTKAKKLKQK
jgi:hypothetical protein